jgi:membrane protein insertase Oxa1/YidC/SpoIIIJ
MLWARMVAYVTGTVNQELPNWGWAIVVLTLVINK